MTLQGRLKLATRIGEYQKARFDRVRGQCDLIYRNGVFYQIVVVDAPENTVYDPVGALGVDLGIENIAVDSDRQIFESKKVDKAMQHYSKQRSVLQKVGTKSAKRKLKNISGRERLFKKDINHVISKAIVSKVKGTAIRLGMEELKYIRSRVPVRHSQRDMADYVGALNVRNRVPVNEPMLVPRLESIQVLVARCSLHRYNLHLF